MYSNVAGIDVHKKILAVAVGKVTEGTLVFERKLFGARDHSLAELSEWLKQQGVEEVVMESTAQYWKPVWLALEGSFRLHLAQAQSNLAPRGRKKGSAGGRSRRFFSPFVRCFSRVPPGFRPAPSMHYNVAHFLDFTPSV